MRIQFICPAREDRGMFISIILLSIGFSAGVALLSAFAYASTYHSLLLSSHSRIAGNLILAGLTCTKLLSGR